MPRDQTPPSCPVCGNRLVPIVYGFPTTETWEAESRGELVIGGCIDDPGMPTVTCLTCSETESLP